MSAMESSGVVLDRVGSGDECNGSLWHSPVWFGPKGRYGKRLVRFGLV